MYNKTIAFLHVYFVPVVPEVKMKTAAASGSSAEVSMSSALASFSLD